MLLWCENTRGSLLFREKKGLFSLLAVAPCLSLGVGSHPGFASLCVLSLLQGAEAFRKQLLPVLVSLRECPEFIELFFFPWRDIWDGGKLRTCWEV